jgi:threonine synthase
MEKTTIRCIDCGKTYKPGAIYRCSCSGLLEAFSDIASLKKTVSKDLFDSRLGSRKTPYGSGVWRYRELIHPIASDKDIVSKPEGNTNVYSHRKLSDYVGVKDIAVKHEGENPTGSFKDRGMTVGITEAMRLGMEYVACASTGNTSASMASYAAMAGMKSVVFIPEGEIAYGKLSQALAYGSQVLQVRGNFDDAMALVQESADALGIYLLNSINPWRVEGQKSIIFELIQQLSWESPDWITVPAGNLGNTSAFGKAIKELKELGFIDKVPKLASIQAHGANPLYQMWTNDEKTLPQVKNPKTIATAIKIGNPVSWKKALVALRYTGGTVEEATDQEIMDAKAIVDSCGIGCEPASAASVAGARKLVEKGVIKRDEKVVCITTGNILKDPDATINYHLSKIAGMTPKYSNKPTVIDATLEAVKKAIIK